MTSVSKTKNDSNLLLSYYGDDFTGSTDVMEVLQWAGLRTVLFLEPPSTEQLSRFEGLRAFGVAGWGRTMSPSEMDEEMVPILDSLKRSGSSLVQYKTCSTFDSSPEVGSIGKVIEIGREVFQKTPIPVLIGAPMLGRYQAFGNLFARSGLDTEPFRLDRHPTMSCHPITPMDESDLRLHLSKQTRLSVELFDLLRLEGRAPEKRFQEIRDEDPAAILIDVVSNKHLSVIGKILDLFRLVDSGNQCPAFLVGSSGIEYALVEHWSETNQLEDLRSRPPGKPGFGQTDQVIVLTGSCSPVNAIQIDCALQNGFDELPLNPARLINPETRHGEVHRSVADALLKLENGCSLILHTSKGPEDSRIHETMKQYAEMGFSHMDTKLKNGRTLGPILGRILKSILDKRPFKRLAVAGGDTSGYVAREVGIEALEAIAPVAPGSPLCRIRASNSLDHCEILFKGGQVGRKDIWLDMLNGRKSAD